MFQLSKRPQESIVADIVTSKFGIECDPAWFFFDCGAYMFDIVSVVLEFWTGAWLAGFNRIDVGIS